MVHRVICSIVVMLLIVYRMLIVMIRALRCSVNDDQFSKLQQNHAKPKYKVAINEIGCKNSGRKGRITIDSGAGESVMPTDMFPILPLDQSGKSKIKYIAAYQTQPVSAITHYAPVSRIESYGEQGKYRLVFSEKAKSIGPIPLGNAPTGTMQGSRYTTFTKLQSANTISDLWG